MSHHNIHGYAATPLFSQLDRFWESVDHLKPWVRGPQYPLERNRKRSRNEKISSAFKQAKSWESAYLHCRCPSWNETVGFGLSLDRKVRQVWYRLVDTLDDFLSSTSNVFMKEARIPCFHGCFAVDCIRIRDDSMLLAASLRMKQPETWLRYSCTSGDATAKHRWNFTLLRRHSDVTTMRSLCYLLLHWGVTKLLYAPRASQLFPTLLWLPLTPQQLLLAGESNQ